VGFHVIDVGEGKHHQAHIIFKRDIVNVVKELIGNLKFDGFVCYAPEWHWTSKRCKFQVYGETWTRNWWWRAQMSCLTLQESDQ
jgi:hypothetical protein